MTQDSAASTTASGPDSGPNSKAGRVKVSVGVVFSAKELELEIEGEPASIVKAVQAAVADGKALVLHDAKGKLIVVPADKLCYVEVHSSDSQGSIGFGF